MKPQINNPQPKFLKVPPNAPDLEQVVLGAILLDRSAMDTVAEILDRNSFYKHENQAVFAACQELYNSSSPIDSMTVMQQLMKTGEINEAGGSAYIASLTMNVGSSANLEYHARVLKQYQIRRELIQAGMQIEAAANDDTLDGLEALEAAEAEIFRIVQGNQRGAGVNMQKVLLVALSGILDILDNPGKITGITTGFSKWDAYSLGLQRQSLTLLAGRPGMGKTTVACEIALAAAQSGSPVIFFSIGDMSAEELAEKMVLMVAKVPFLYIRNRTATAEHRQRIAEATETMASLPIKIYDIKATGGPDFSTLRSIARKQVQSAGCKLIIFDYLQQIRITNYRERALVEEVSRSLKILAATLDVPVIALSQLSRAVETRGGDRRPIMSDLRESGSLEQDADAIYFVYRPEYYKIMEDETGQSLAGVTEIIAAKHRKSGDLRTIMLKRNNDTGRYEQHKDGDEQTFEEKIQDQYNANIVLPADTNIDLPF